MLEATDFTLKNIGKADLVIYLTDNDKKGFSGIAPEGTLCIPSSQQKSVCLESGLGCQEKPANAWKYCINEYLKSVASMGKVCLNNNLKQYTVIRELSIVCLL